MAHLELAVQVFEEDDQLGGVGSHDVDRETDALRDVTLQGAVRYVLHHEEQVLFVLQNVKFVRLIEIVWIRKSLGN